jgi:hypothetical protein
VPGFGEERGDVLDGERQGCRSVPPTRFNLVDGRPEGFLAGGGTALALQPGPSLF